MLTLFPKVIVLLNWLSVPMLSLYRVKYAFFVQVKYVWMEDVLCPNGGQTFVGLKHVETENMPTRSNTRSLPIQTSFLLPGLS